MMDLNNGRSPASGWRPVMLQHPLLCFCSDIVCFCMQVSNCVAAALSAWHPFASAAALRRATPPHLLHLLLPSLALGSSPAASSCAALHGPFSASCAFMVTVARHRTAALRGFLPLLVEGNRCGG